MKIASFRFLVALLMLSLTLGPSASRVRAENKFNFAPKSGARVAQGAQGSSSSGNSAGRQFKTMPKVVTNPVVTQQGNGGGSNSLKKLPINTLPKYGQPPVVVKPTLPGGGVKNPIIKPKFPIDVVGGGNKPVTPVKPKFPIDLGDVVGGGGNGGGTVKPIKPKFPIDLGDVVGNPPKPIKPKFPIDLGDIVDVSPNVPVKPIKPKFPIDLPDFPLDPGFPIDPGFPVDPGNGGGGNGGGGNGSDPHDHCDHWFGWPWIVGVPVGGLPPIYVGGPSYGGGTTVINNTPTTPVVETPAAADPLATTAAVDLELSDLRLVDEGLAAGDGPRYRVTVRNATQHDYLQKMTVMLVASRDGRPAADAPRAMKSADGLAAGAETTVDIRLPGNFAQQADLFTYLTAVVQPAEGVVDVEPNDNAATYERAAVREVNLQVLNVRFENGLMVVEGEGFGRETGRVMLGADAARQAMQTASWRPTQVAFRLPTDGSLKAGLVAMQLVRADGRASEATELNFAK